MRIRILLLITAWAMLPLGASASGVTLTDITVFSTNEQGENWNSLIWNTQGSDVDLPAPTLRNDHVPVPPEP